METRDTCGFSVIAALDEENGIGFQGRLPWKITSEMKFFKKTTTSGSSNAVIMGRKTWESLKDKLLAGRVNIVLSSSLIPSDEFLVFKTLDEALRYCESEKIACVWVIGGSQIYSHALLSSRCRQVVLSRIKGVHKCDTKFPIDLMDSYQLDRTEDRGVEWFVEYYSRPIWDKRDGFRATCQE